MFAYLLLQVEVGDCFDEIVHGVDVGVYAFEALDFFAYEEAVLHLMLDLLCVF